MEKPVDQQKVPVPKMSRIQDKNVPIPHYAISHIRFKDDSGSRMVNRMSIQDINRKLPAYPDPTCRPPPKPVKLLMPEVPRNLLDINPEIKTDFKENSPFQEGVISETYQRPDKSYFQEPQKLHSLIKTVRLVQKFLTKQADIDKM